MFLQATCNQGHAKFKGKGQQCMSNSLCAISTSLTIPPSQWTIETMDNILHKGDDLFCKTPCSQSYWCSDDIPSSVDSFHLVKKQHFHGTVKMNITDHPFYSLDQALEESFSSNMCAIFTMGHTQPCYSCAIIQEGENLYFFDPHSRSTEGMPVPEGFATLSSHRNVKDIVSFIKKLSETLSLEGKDIPFELVQISNTPCSLENDSSSEFSGFSLQSEGHTTCVLYLAEENVKKVMERNFTDVSDVSSDDNLDIVEDSENESVNGSLCESIIGNVLNDMNTSADYFQSINENAFSDLSSDNNYCESDDTFMDKDYIPSDDDLDDDDDDDDDDGINVDGNPVHGNDQVDDDADGVNIDSNPVHGNDQVDDDGVNFDCNPVHGNDQVDDGNDQVDDDADGVNIDRNPVHGNDLVDDKDDGVNVDGNPVHGNDQVDDDDNDVNLDDGDDDDDIPLIHLAKKKHSLSTPRQADHVQTEPKTKRSATNVTLDTSGLRRSRKRLKNSELWKRNILKRRRNQGLQYLTEKGNLRHAREIKPGCGPKCRYKCHQHFSNTDRQKIFHGFWQLGDINRQRNFIAKFASQKVKKQGSSAKRKHSVSYMFPVSGVSDGKNPGVKVCKTFFLDTLSVSERYITTTHKKTNIGIVANDNRGKHKNRPHRINCEQLEFIRSHIESFPTMESHYCRKDSSREYLSPDLNITKMYSLYKEKCHEKCVSPVSSKVYRNVFTTEYNISFNRPIKDQCDFCVAYKNALPEQRASMEDQYKNHIDNKILARDHKEKDKNRAKEDKSFICACFDLQEILITPKSFESCMFYKRRLNSYNFSLYEFCTKNGYCYLWNESVSNRGACEIGSCVFDFIKQKTTESDDVKEFVFYSDNCCSQNKNRYYITMLWYCLQKFNIKSITHKYLEKGHTQNENDAIHSTIESASKNIPIFTCSQWAAVIRSARRDQPFKVKEMSLRDFFDFKAISKTLKNFEINTDGEKVYWNAIKWLQLTSGSPNTLMYKTHHAGQVFYVDLLKRLRTNIPHPSSLELKQLNQSEIPISKEKYIDLITLCRKQIIPAAHHPFYILLPHKII